MKKHFNKEYTTISLYIIIVFFICLMLYRATNSLGETMDFITNTLSVITPVIVGLIIAYFINPLVNRFELYVFKNISISKKNNTKNARFRRAISIIFTYVITLSFIFILISMIVPQLGDSIVDFGSTLTNLDNTQILEKFENLGFTLGTQTYTFNIEKTIQIVEDNIAKIPEYLEVVLPNLLSIVNSFATIAINFLLAIVISIYILFSKEGLAIGARKIIIALFPRKQAMAIFETVHLTDEVFSSFFIGKLLDSLIIGVLCFIFLIIFKIPFALLLSVVVGITNIIPYFGPFFGGGIGFVLLILIAPFKAFVFFIIVLVLQQFDGNILGPMILGDSLNLPPFWIIFSIILFGGLFGPIGMFIGAPLFSVIRTLISRSIDRRYDVRMYTEYERE